MPPSPFPELLAGLQVLGGCSGCCCDLAPQPGPALAAETSQLVPWVLPGWPLAPFGEVSVPPATLRVSLATQNHKHQAVGAKRDRPNTKPGNWAINIYTLCLGFTHSAASEAQPAAEVQVLTVLLVVVQDFQPDHKPLQPGPDPLPGMLFFPARGANASCSGSGVPAASDLPRFCPDQRSLAAQPALRCCEHNCSNIIWAQLPDPQQGSPP